MKKITAHADLFSWTRQSRRLLEYWLQSCNLAPVGLSTRIEPYFDGLLDYCAGCRVGLTLGSINNKHEQHSPPTRQDAQYHYFHHRWRSHCCQVRTSKTIPKLNAQEFPSSFFIYIYFFLLAFRPMQRVPSHPYCRYIISCIIQSYTQEVQEYEPHARGWCLLNARHFTQREVCYLLQ